MENITDTSTGKFISLDQQLYLHAEFDKKDRFTGYNNKAYKRITSNDSGIETKIVASRNIKTKYLPFFEYKKKKQSKEGSMIINVTPDFYRGKLNPDELIYEEFPKKKFRKYLGETDDINTFEDCVTETAKEIINQLPKKQRNNPYAITEEIMHWLKDNIEYTLIRDGVLNKVSEMIKIIPESKYNKISNNDLVKHIINIKGPGENEKEINACFESFKRKVGLIVERNPDRNEMAKDLLKMIELTRMNFSMYLNNLSYDISEKEDLEQSRILCEYILDCKPLLSDSTAKQTIEKKKGVCSGISKAFIAISRNIGIPSKYITGWGISNFHAWTASYFPQLGWVEADPTWDTKIKEFNYSNHYYSLCGSDTFQELNNIPKLTILKKENIDEKIKDLISYSEDKFLYNLSGRKQEELEKFKQAFDIS